MTIDVPIAWAGVIAFSLMMYVVMDGFDLGIGILFPFVSDRSQRDTMINTIAPIRDGNETWLVLGGASLMGAFPIAYGILLTALYIPMILMLVGLICRGVAFEFRFEADGGRRPAWDLAFVAGSYVATFAQGACLGAFINGLPIADGAYEGGPLDWLTPFSVMTGAGVLGSYALLGATWLILKTGGALKERMIEIARCGIVIVVGMTGVVSLWTPLTHAAIAQRWFSWPNVVIFSPVPLLVVVAAGVFLRELSRAPQGRPFGLALGILFLGYSGLAISLWPNIVPPGISIWAASSSPQSQAFMLVGALAVIPIILGYTGWSYYVFRGEVTAHEGYH